VKLAKQIVGLIEDGAPHRIRLQVMKSDIAEDGNTSCEWKWITLKGEFQSVDAAKEFLNVNFTTITEKWKLYGKHP